MTEAVPTIEYKSEINNLNTIGNNMEYTNDDQTNLIINYLPVEIDEIGLSNLFSEHGNIVQTKVVRDKVTKKSLG
jgi:RNA recognition motif-containing protein